mmetsp:Transcript_15377/g.37847  ORF Transcript_15377/g.37847 Transcript_15377/m.37847 type:complete len:200 (+) Transcript_15377:1700-2299(+)
MLYQGQKIKATFTADGGFTVSGITSVEFDGINAAVDEDSKTFGISAKRCDVNRNALTSPPALAVGTTLFICIDSTDVNAVIKSVDTFGATKTSGGALTNLLTGNTEVKGEGTDAVTIGTRPFVQFFADTTPLEIRGTVTLEVTDNGVTRRHLVRILQTGLSEEFELEVELEAVEESSANSAAFSTAAVALSGGIIAAIM